jgi:hypothetical protein
MIPSFGLRLLFPTARAQCRITTDDLASELRSLRAGHETRCRDGEIREADFLTPSLTRATQVRR